MIFTVVHSCNIHEVVARIRELYHVEMVALTRIYGCLFDEARTISQVNRSDEECETKKTQSCELLHESQHNLIARGLVESR